MLPAQQLTRFLHSRWCLMVMMLVAIVCACVSFSSVGLEAEPTDYGVLLSSANLWIESPIWSAVLSVLAVLGLSLLMNALNRTYNLLRSSTRLDAAFFIVIVVGMPALMMSFGPGVLLCPVVLLCLFLLYGTYGCTRTCQRHIYLIFLLLSALTMTQYSFALYVPVFLIGCMQMRVFNGRTLLAALFGLLTPWWLVFGLGLMPLSAFHLPDFAEIVGNFRMSHNLMTYLTIGFTAILMVVTWILNFPKMIAYNAHMRAYNGMLSVLSLATLLFMALDFVNMSHYALLLAMCAAFQTGRLFVGRQGKSYVAILLLFAVFLILFVCQITVLKLL